MVKTIKISMFSFRLRSIESLQFLILSVRVSRVFGMYREQKIKIHLNESKQWLPLRSFPLLKRTKKLGLQLFDNLIFIKLSAAG